MFGLGKLIYVVLLVINGIAVLSEDRFLNRIGWGSTSGQADQYGFNAGDSDTSVKTKLINLISAIRTLLRVPLIAINIVVIVYELILG